MVNEFQKMINLLNIVDEQHRLEGEDERDYCRSIICEVIKMLKKCSEDAEGNKNNKQSKSGNAAKLPVGRRAKRFNWKEFKKYVETYDPEKHGGNNAETIFQDMLYGLGTAVDKKYRFADGFQQFKQWLFARLHGG